MEHDYFGVVGDYWSERVEAGDQEVEVVLEASDGTSAIALDAAAAMIVDLERLDAQVRESFVAEIASGGSATSEFIAFLVDDLDPDTLDDAIRRVSGDRQMDILRSLDLLRVDFRADNDGSEESFALFEYAFAPDDSEVRLVATADVSGAVVSVEFQE